MGDVTLSASRHANPRHVKAAATIVSMLAAACASANDPTHRAEVRAEVSDEAAWLVADAAREARTVRDLAGTGGQAAKDTPAICDADPVAAGCPEPLNYVDRLLRRVAEAPQDRYVTGEVVYTLTRLGLTDQALEAVEMCATVRWWCQALRGHVLAQSHSILPAGIAFDSALTAMPEPIRCAWTNLSLYIWGGAWPAFQGESCLERLNLLERLWWLADPAWLVPGNDREVEHYNRVISIMLLTNARRGDVDDSSIEYLATSRTQRRFRTREDQTVLFGTQSLRDPVLRWDERRREIVYGVIPRAPALLDPFHALPEDWPILPAGMIEHYEPEFGRLATLDHQVAFFERGDALLAIAAADVPDSLGFGSADAARVVLFLQTGPGAPPLTAAATTETGLWLFRMRAPQRRYLVGIEARSDQGVARARFGHGLPQDASDPLRLSDLLLFVPEPSRLPDSLEQAVLRMRGSRDWNRGEVVGAFFEVYGAERGGPLTVSVELDRRLSGHPSETRGVGGGEPFRLEWLLPDSDAPRPVTFTLDLRDIEPGEYVLRASVGPPNAAATVRKVVRVVEASS